MDKIADNIFRNGLNWWQDCIEAGVTNRDFIVESTYLILSIYLNSCTRAVHVSEMRYTKRIGSSTIGFIEAKNTGRRYIELRRSGKSRDEAQYEVLSKLRPGICCHRRYLIPICLSVNAAVSLILHYTVNLGAPSRE